jgi:2-amino-4-hydroxy-6-hydroxymethyldihydropteridine diphosphokinase
VKSNIYILLGSNLGDREQHLSKAREKIQKAGCTITLTSSIYQTSPWGKTNQPDFLNQVICITTKFNALELLGILLQIETALGRIRSEKWGERTIDLDILFYDNQVIAREDLTIPHPGISSRRFTLVPLCEISAEFIHPVLQENLKTLLEKCPDLSLVEKFKP